ncbi:MAG: thioredoxin domain-containing protein [Pseudonocardiales bacterium]|jgi:protein-disulfide isomerase|nr:thioredoxin domain-containing protein [Pseudonocardiales bacterium]
MGGASRAEKRRKQQQAEERLRRAGITPPTREKDNRRTTFIAVSTLAVVALIVGVVVLLTRDTGAPVVPTYTATASEGVVTAGNGPIVVDVYEDFLCPVCERFEERYGEELTTALNEGRITVRYHGVSILDELTDPPGFSTRAANAALCATDAGVFPAYHARLFDEQPAEGSAGLTDAQLVAFGTDLGVDIGQCVTGAANAGAVAAATEAARSNPAALNADGQFGTPTVLLDGARVDLGDTGWLQDALAR